MTDIDDSDPNAVDDSMTPGRAAFETWYASMASINPMEISPDAWAAMGEHQELWNRVAAAAITAHNEA